MSNYTNTPHDQTYYQPIERQPSIVGKWNWGAFALNWIWGLFNGSFLPLLCFIPLFNLVWIFICGFNGNQWAWDSHKFTTVEEFETAQCKWNNAGLIVFIISLVFHIIHITLYILLVVIFAMNLYQIQ